MFNRRDLFTALGIVGVTAFVLVGVKLLQTSQFSLPQAANVTYTYYPWGTKRNNTPIPSGPNAVLQMNSSLNNQNTTTFFNGPGGTFWEWSNHEYVRDARWQLSAFNGIWKPVDQVKTPSAWGGNQPNNLYPWTDNGPTAAFRNEFSNTIHVCNQGWCWIYDRTTSKWAYDGKPIDLEYEWKTKPGTPLVQPGEINGQTVYPWTEINGVAGPTSANYSPETSTIAICNVVLCWYQNGPTTFANNGNAYDIRTSNAFEGSVKPWDYDGNGQEDNPLIGLTASWSDATGKSRLCTYDKCWSYNSELRKYQPYTLSSTNPAGGATVQPFTQQTTVADPTSTPTQSPPCVPSIAAPSNNSTVQYPFDLKINNTCQSPKYQLDIKNNQTNQSSTLHINQPVSKPAQITIPATNILIDEPDNPSGSFTFKIKSCTSTQESSCTGNWSPTVTFTIQAPTSDPCVLSSLSGELISNASGIKVDSNPSGGCDNVDYVFKITNPDESNSYINNRVGYINKYNVDDGMYVVKAKLCDYGTGTSNTCKYAGQEVYTESFYYWVSNGRVSLTDPNPPCFLRQETPADGASVALPVDFSWNDCSSTNRWDVTFYNLTSSGQADINSIAKRITNVTDNQVTVTATDLNPGTYAWKVTTDGGWTASFYRIVEIQASAPVSCTPTLYQPTNGANKQLPVTLTWNNNCSNAGGYEYHLTNGTRVIRNTYTPSSNTRTSVTLNSLNGFANNDQITWKVRTCSDDLTPCNDPGPWSQTRTFTLNTSLPDLEVTGINRTGNAGAYNYSIVVANTGNGYVGTVDVVADAYVNPANIPPTSTDTPTQTFTHSYSLSAGEAFNPSLTGQTDADAIVCVIVDPDNTIAEADETNNVACYDMSTNQPYQPAQSGSIAGIVFADQDGGTADVPDAGEGIQGLRVKLKCAATVLPGYAGTNANGEYIFEDILSACVDPAKDNQYVVYLNRNYIPEGYDIADNSTEVAFAVGQNVTGVNFELQAEPTGVPTEIPTEAPTPTNTTAPTESPTATPTDVPIYATDLRKYLADYSVEPVAQPVNFIRMISDHFLSWLQ